MAQRSFFRDIGSVIGSNAFTEVVKFIIGIILARILAPEGRGLYASILVVPLMIIGLTELGIKRAVIQHVGEKIFPLQRIIRVLTVALLITSFLGIVICGFVYYLLDNAQITTPLIILALLNIPIILLLRFAHGIFTGMERYRMANTLNWVPVIFNLLFLVVFVWLLRFFVFGALLALLLANLSIAAFFILKLGKEFHFGFGFDRKVLISLFQMGFIYALALFLVRLNFRIDIIILERLTDISEIGYYTIGTGLAEKWQVPLTIGSVILSKSANISDQKYLNENVSKLIRLTLIFGIFISFLIFFIAPFIIPLLYGADYIPSIPITRAILPAILMLAISRIMSTRLAGLRRTYSVIFIYLPALVINIFFNIILIPSQGAMGAVIATNISYLAASLGIFLLYFRHTGTSLKDVLLFRKADFDFFTGRIRNVSRFFKE